MKKEDLKINALKKAATDCKTIGDFEDPIPQKKDDVLGYLIECDAELTEEEKAQLQPETKELIKYAKLQNDDFEGPEDVEEIDEEEEMEEEQELKETEEVDADAVVDTAEEAEVHAVVDKKAKKQGKAKTTTKEKAAPKAKTTTKKKGPGVIATIVECVENAGKKGISREEILVKLEEVFPEKEPKSMKNTIAIQVPYRINKEKFPVVQLENGNYAKK